MTDPIKAALDAATRAFQTLDGHDPEYDDTPKVAAAIVAFLHRVANVHAGAYASMEPREMLKCFAAAVEEAARHE